MLHDKGWSLRQIAEALLISDEAVRNHIQDYETAKKLRPESGGSQEKLSHSQSQLLEAHLLKHTYLETSKIKLHFLPPYSPNLNPIERLWKWMKERVIYNTYYPEFDEFKSAIFGFF